MADESEAPGPKGCAEAGEAGHTRCHCDHGAFLIGKYPELGKDAIMGHLDRLDNQTDPLEATTISIMEDQSEIERDVAEL